MAHGPASQRVISSPATLDDLSDVNTSGAQEGHVLRFDGSSWVPGNSSFLESMKPGSADTPDADFNGSLGNYTAVAGSSGTVNLLLAGTDVTTVYDLTSRPGHLLIQVGTADLVSFRCDYTIPDGRSIVLAIAGSPQAQAGDNMVIGVNLNDDNTTATSGNFVRCMLEQDTTEWVAQATTSADTTGTEISTRSFNVAQAVFLRIVRATLTYHCFVSVDGLAWTWIDSFVFAGALDNVWISVTGSSTADRAHIVSIPWIREGDDTVDPWVWTT